LRKGVFHTHLFLWTWRAVTQVSKYIQIWKFSTFLHHRFPKFKAFGVFNLKLWIIKVVKLDVCGRPLIANRVTILVCCFNEGPVELTVQCTSHNYTLQRMQLQTADNMYTYVLYYLWTNKNYLQNPTIELTSWCQHHQWIL